MARRTSPTRFSTDKFENVHQIGGIRTGTLDAPSPGQPCRVAHVDTGSGLRFTVALDRGGDIVEAFFNQHSLAFLSQVDYRPPSPAYAAGLEWLRGWAGGLVTTCGPEYIGRPRTEDGVEVGLHGRHSSNPADVEMVLNPDPHRGRREMLLSMVIRDTKMFGPTLEVRRQIQCVLGMPEIHIYDQVTNRGNLPTAHAWLYHVNLGYPLLDQGARLIYRGKRNTAWNIPQGSEVANLDAPLPPKLVPAPLKEHAGSGERGVIVESTPDARGLAHAGLINDKLGLGIELEYPADALPRLANWQHFGPAGSYVTGLEPFSGSLMGRDRDDFHDANQKLAPGETRRYQLILRVHHTPAGLKTLAKSDGPVK